MTTSNRTNTTRLLTVFFLVWPVVLCACRPIMAESGTQRLALSTTIAQQRPNGAPVRSSSPQPPDSQATEGEADAGSEQSIVLPDEGGDAQTSEDRPVVWMRQGVYDPVGEQDAFAVWVPQGWALEGSVHYNPVPSLAIMSTFTVRDPNAAIGAETISSEMQLAWTEGPFGAAPEGDYYFGNLIERPKDGIKYFQQNLLPALRQTHPDYQVLDLVRDTESIEALRRLHDLEMTTGMVRELGGQVEFDAIAVRATYTVEGRTIEETIHAQFQYVGLQVGTMQSVTWGLIWSERLFAPLGALQERAPLLKAIARSARPNYDWYVAVESHRYQVWDIAVNAQRAWDDYIDYQNERMAKYDEIYEGFNHYLRGTDIKRNPMTGEMWELPDLYRHIWFSADGRILFTDITGYDPNSDAALGGTWQEAP